MLLSKLDRLEFAENYSYMTIEELMTKWKVSRLQILAEAKRQGIFTTTIKAHHHAIMVRKENRKEFLLEKCRG